MDITKTKYFAGLVFAAALTTACSEKMPVVNEENCIQENIDQIEDQKIREEFSDQCFDFRIEQGKEQASKLLDQSQEKAKSLYEDGKDAAAELYNDTEDAVKNGADAVEDSADAMGEKLNSLKSDN